MPARSARCRRERPELARARWRRLAAFTRTMVSDQIPCSGSLRCGGSLHALLWVSTRALRAPSSTLTLDAGLGAFPAEPGDPASSENPDQVRACQLRLRRPPVETPALGANNGWSTDFVNMPGILWCRRNLGTTASCSASDRAAMTARPSSSPTPQPHTPTLGLSTCEERRTDRRVS